MKKSLNQFVYESLDNGEYLTDSDVYKFRNRSDDIYTAETYKQNYHRLKRDRDYFNNQQNTGIKIIGLHKYKSKYHAKLEYGMFMKISKAYFNEILHLYKRNMSRPDLIDVYDYDLIKE
jgi:hypothetical protein